MVTIFEVTYFATNRFEDTS